MTIDDLVNGTLRRLDEDPTAPLYFGRREVRNYIAEALFEATLYAGEPQVMTGEVTIAANQTFQALPSGVFALMRVESMNLPVKKEYIHVMDRMLPTWQKESGTKLKAWIPLGLGPYWAVYPKLEEEIKVTVSAVVFPAPDTRPLAGTEDVIFQNEYLQAFEEMAKHIAALKEGGAEFQQSIPSYNKFLATMGELSKFASRKGFDRFSRSAGAISKVNDVETK